MSKRYSNDNWQQFCVSLMRELNNLATHDSSKGEVYDSIKGLVSELNDADG